MIHSRQGHTYLFSFQLYILIKLQFYIYIYVVLIKLQTPVFSLFKENVKMIPINARHLAKLFKISAGLIVVSWIFSIIVSDILHKIQKFYKIHRIYLWILSVIRVWLDLQSSSFLLSWQRWRCLHPILIQLKYRKLYNFYYIPLLL